jgi:pilus assembly protein CpaB
MKIGPLIIAIMLAAVAAVFVMRSGSDAPQTAQRNAQVTVKPARVETVNIYVAAQPIQIGSVITKDLLIEQPWPKHLMVDGFIVADGKTTIEGRVARAAFTTQEPLISSKLANVNDPSFLAGNLPKGMRVVTLRTNEIDGLAGLLFPGDRIDIILSRKVENALYENPDQQRFAEEIVVTENILNNVLVLAVDQKTEAVELETGRNGQKKRRFTPPRSVSLMVTPQNARRLRLAEHVAVSSSGGATLSLSLRALQDKDQVENEKLHITFVNDVSQYRPQIITAQAQIEQQKSVLVTVVRGIEVEDKKQKKQQLDIEDVVSSPALIAASRSSRSNAR